MPSCNGISYSLMEGLTAMCAYGVIIMANIYLCDFIKTAFKDWPKQHQIFNHFLLFGMLGITFLACRIGKIIVHSEVSISVSGATGLSLAILIFIPQVWIFDKLIHTVIIYIFTNNFLVELFLCGLICIPWIWSIINSMFTDSNWNYLIMLAVIFSLSVLTIFTEYKVASNKINKQ